MNRRILTILLIFLLSICFDSSMRASELSGNTGNHTDDEITMLQKIAICEANIDGEEGMAYVIKTVMNRVESDKFPNSIKDVIYQKNQFSTIKSGAYDKAKPTEESLNAYYKALEMDNEALFFENDHGKKNTWHQRNLQFLFEYEHHKFYK